MSDAIFCKICGEKIDEIKVRKAGPRKPPEHCTRACVEEAHRRSGHFGRMGALGNQAQQAVKAITGHVPAYEKRRDAVVASNKEHPRRKQRKSND